MKHPKKLLIIASLTFLLLGSTLVFPGGGMLQISLLQQEDHVQESISFNLSPKNYSQIEWNVPQFQPKERIEIYGITARTSLLLGTFSHANGNFTIKDKEQYSGMALRYHNNLGVQQEEFINFTEESPIGTCSALTKLIPISFDKHFIHIDTSTIKEKYFPIHVQGNGMTLDQTEINYQQSVQVQHSILLPYTQLETTASHIEVIPKGCRQGIKIFIGKDSTIVTPVFEFLKNDEITLKYALTKAFPYLEIPVQANTTPDTSDTCRNSRNKESIIETNDTWEYIEFCDGALASIAPKSTVLVFPKNKQARLYLRNGEIAYFQNSLQKNNPILRSPTNKIYSISGGVYMTYNLQKGSGSSNLLMGSALGTPEIEPSFLLPTREEYNTHKTLFHEKLPSYREFSEHILHSLLPTEYTKEKLQEPLTIGEFQEILNYIQFHTKKSNKGSNLPLTEGGLQSIIRDL